MRRPAPALAIAAMLLLSACGPEKKVTLGVRDVATDILLSGATPPSPPPATPKPKPPAPPGFPFVPTPVTPKPGGGFVPLPPKPSAPPPPQPVACPTAPSFVSPRHAAGTRPAGRPVAATYGVRTDGEFTITGANAASGVYPPTGVRVVRDVVDLGDFRWTYVVDDGNGLATTYQVIPRQVANDETPVDSANQPVPTQPGIYVSRFDYRRTDGSVLTLDPEPSLMVAKVPFAPGDKWTSRGVDSRTGVTIVVNGQTGIGPDFTPSRARVDACGTLLDAWWVEYTVDTTPLADGVPEPPSQIEGPDILVRFVGSRVAFAPQFGGLAVEETYTLDGTDKADGLKIRRHTVYSREPALAAAQ